MPPADAHRDSQLLNLRPAGARGATPVVWATRAGCAVLAAGAIFAAWSALRPLPEPGAVDAPAIPTVRHGFGAQESLDAREAILARLSGAGNIFAPDRSDWKTQTADRRGQRPDGEGADEPKSEAKPDPRAVAQTPPKQSTTTPGAPIPFDSIPVVEKPPAGVAKDLSDLRLRGVYTTPEGTVALIGTIRQKNSKRAEPRRVGDLFGDEEWSVVAIDEVGKRVILGRAGINVQLSMWDYQSPLASAKPAAAAAPQVVKPSVVVYSRTPEQVRADLLAAGISPDEIEEVLALSESTPSEAVAEAPKTDIVTIIPEAPEAMTELLKMMSSDAGMPKVTPAHMRERAKRRPRPTEPPK